MRWLTRFLGFTFGLPLLCAFAFAALFVASVGVAAEQLPAWAQKPVAGWLLGQPQLIGSEAGFGDPSSSPAGIGVGWDGYADADAAPPNGLPLAGNVYITCGFHDPAYTSHTGVDLVLWPEQTLGAPVYTTMAGKVVWAGWNGPWGNLVVVENAGYQVWFAHLVEIDVLAGQILAQGDVVGSVGSTGNSTGPHLHYGIKLQTEGGGQVWLDPVGYFGGAEYGYAVCA